MLAAKGAVRLMLSGLCIRITLTKFVVRSVHPHFLTAEKMLLTHWYANSFSVAIYITLCYYVFTRGGSSGKSCSDASNLRSILGFMSPGLRAQSDLAVKSHHEEK